MDTERLAAPLRPADLTLARIFGMLSSKLQRDRSLSVRTGEGGFGSVGVVKVEKTRLEHKRNLRGSQMAVKIFKKRELRNDAPVSTSVQSPAQ